MYLHRKIVAIAVVVAVIVVEVVAAVVELAVMEAAAHPRVTMINSRNVFPTLRQVVLRPNSK
jgi:hypothetical protein